MRSLPVPDERLLHYFPEASLLAVLDAALAAAALSLRAEHPTVDDLPLAPDHDVAPTLLVAHLLIRRADDLRGLLEIYSAAVHRAVSWQPSDEDIPF